MRTEAEMERFKKSHIPIDISSEMEATQDHSTHESSNSNDDLPLSKISPLLTEGRESVQE